MSELVCPYIVFTMDVNQGRSHPVVLLCERHCHRYGRVRPTLAVVVCHCVCVPHDIRNDGEPEVHLQAVGRDMFISISVAYRSRAAIRCCGVLSSYAHGVAGP